MSCLLADLLIYEYTGYTNESVHTATKISSSSSSSTETMPDPYSSSTVAHMNERGLCKGDISAA